LLEAGNSGVNRDLATVDPRGLEAPAAWTDLKSPENYVGYDRTENFASPGGALQDGPRIYTVPGRLPLNHWALSGDWTMAERAVVLNKPNGRIAYRFHARDLHLVMGPATGGGTVRFACLSTERRPALRTEATSTIRGFGTAGAQRLYQLIRQSAPVADHTFEIEFLDPGVEAYAFTFG
jgi:hypothetical protein